MQMFDLLAHRARVTPDRTAVEDLEDGSRYSYAALNAQAARFAAAATRRWGLNAGDRIAWLGHNRAEFFAMLFGCAKAGLILVPMNWRLAPPELESIVTDCQPRAVIYGGELADAAAALGERDRTLTLIGLDAADDHRDYHADLATSVPDPAPHPERDPDTPWYLLYTSGTTGRAKGVIYTFRMLLANYLSIGTAVDLTSADALLDVLPMFHTAGINLYATPILVAGGTVLVQRQFEAEATLAHLAERASVFFGVPAIYEAMLEHPSFDGEKLRGVRSWGCGGAPLSLPAAQRFAEHGIRVRTGMGMTETGPTVFLLDEDRVLDKIGSVGTPQLLAEVRIVDAECRDVAPGEAGELLFRGPGVTPGYWGQPRATQDAFEPGGWLHSGDIAWYDDDGCYYIVDRCKDMYITGGENVYPAEIERVLVCHPGVAEAAVVGMPDKRWGESGKAYVIPRPGSDAPAPHDLEAFCRQRLAAYKVPRVFAIVDALPRNAMGKVTKAGLRADAARG